MNDIKETFKNSIVIGVTGHRDPVFEANVDIIKIIQSIIIHEAEKDPKLPIIVLSPLAEGADQLVAKAVIGLRDDTTAKQYLGSDRIKLFVPLPFKEEWYQQDFDQNSLKDYIAIKEKSDYVFELEPYLEWSQEGLVKISLEVDPNYSSERNVQYANVGAYIVKHSNLLIAMWDGEHIEDVGGTSQIIRLRKDRVMSWGANDNKEIVAPKEFKSESLVHDRYVHIPTGRTKTGSILKLDDSDDENFKAILEVNRMDLY